MDRAVRRAYSTLFTLDLNREDFGPFRDVLARVDGIKPWREE